MNDYSHEVRGWSDNVLRHEYNHLKTGARYSNPAQDIFWLYRAVLEELRNRNIDTKE